MPGVTPNAGIPYPIDGDSLESAVQATPQAAAEAIDLAFGLAGIGMALPKCASIVVATNASGDGIHAFDVPFPAGVLPVVVCSLASLGPQSVQVMVWDEFGFSFRCMQPNGTPWVGLVRVNFIAIPE